MTRYDQLLTIIDREQPALIVETGTWKGDRAVAMCRRARQHQPKVDYFGFDLFEEATWQTDVDELNVKAHVPQHQVEWRIRDGLRGLDGIGIRLVRGNTRRTLQPIQADLAFIDGGHSVETIRSDFERLQGSRVIVLDDYYLPDGRHRCQDIVRYGCNQLAIELAASPGWQVVVLPAQDPVMNGGLVAMVEVRHA